MFGLMKVRNCSLTDVARTDRRLHYCGTCKTLGSRYGAGARLMLNHDAVFLAELLSALAATDGPSAFDSRCLRSYSCLACPAIDDPLPLPLRYAAAATVTHAQWKITDRCHDSSRLRWRLLRRLGAHSFGMATEELRRWQFPLDEMQAVLATQEQRESAVAMMVLSPEALLDHVAAPTATATALFCAHGVQLMGRAACGEAAYALGYSLGTIVYLLDALDDYAQDMKRGEFNAIRSAFAACRHQSEEGEGRITQAVGQAVLDRIRGLQREFEQALARLPLSEANRDRFAAQLAWNLQRTLKWSVPAKEKWSEATAYCPSRMSFGQRWQQAREFGASLTAQFCPAPPTAALSSLAHRALRPVMFASLVPVAFFAPQQAAGAVSYRECLGLGLNLMFLGTVGAVLVQMVSRSALVVALHSMVMGGEAQAFGKGKKRAPGDGDSGGGCDSGCCDCCSGCDCDCCSGCDCDCCSCDC